MRPFVLLPLLLAVGCQEYQLHGNKDEAEDIDGPDIEVEPMHLDFGSLAPDEVGTQTFVVRNVGHLPLHVADLVLAGDGFSLGAQANAFDLGVGDEVEIEVELQASRASHAGEILVLSDDADEPSVPVGLAGLGLLPDLVIEPSYYSFPTECGGTVDLALRNDGAADLVVEAIDYTAPADLVLHDDNPLPLTLAPGESTTVTVEHAPLSAELLEGVLEVSSNDPAGPESAMQVVEIGEGTLTTEQFDVLVDPPVDILFALDTSCSMFEETRHLSQAFDAFIDEIDDVTLDWQIGAVTKNSGCFNQGIITPNTPDYADVFDSAVSGLTLFADYDEALLQLASISLEATLPGECNEGFLRPDAVLHVIAVSDEPEQSGTVWSTWLDEYRSYKANPNQVLVSAVIDPVDDCGSIGDGYIEAAGETGGLILDVCHSDWGSYAADLGAASVAGLQTFGLGAVPDPSTIEVTVDGSALTDWYYDPVANAVVVDAPLNDGAMVELSYVTTGC